MLIPDCKKPTERIDLVTRPAIPQMKDTCEDVVNSIAALTGPDEDVDSFIKDTEDIDDDDEDNVNHRFHHKPFGRLESTSSEVVVLEENELVVASQAKLLMDCSEMMWASGTNN